MTFEKGGRSDKLGNVYENRCLARVLIRLVTEDITSVVVEPIGENADICEFYTTQNDGKRLYYQCKGSNGMQDHWTPSDLQRYDLFSRVQKLLKSDPTCEFRFISPLYYNGLDDLCSRAKTYPSADDYLKYALSNKQLQKVFQSCEKYFNLSSENADQLNEIVNLLARCEFLVQPNNSEVLQDIDQLISVYFWGIPGNTRILLENYVNDTSSYGKELTVSDVLDYLSSKGIQPYPRLHDTRVATAINRLNKSFSESYYAIHGSIFHRESTDLLIKEIEAGKSVILTGKAGSGKSGCIRELVDYLERNQIEHLAIQLDKHIPTDFADKYGEILGLPGSPVISLSHVSGSKPCVLILDQLDALRWTALHSSVSLDVCKELIAQARGINEYTAGHISIVFSVRTFDYENDAGIQSLFNQEKAESPWSVINISNLTDDEVSEIVGDEYKCLTSRVKELIRVPSALYVWLKLDQKRRLNQIPSAQEMVRSWWNQIQDNYSMAGNNSSSLSDCINELVATINKSALFALPQAMFLRYSRELEYLVSGGMLILENGTISFVHQSFLDSFLLEKDLESVFSDKQSFLSLIESWGTQMPIYRYRLSALFQNFIESDQSLFAKQATEFLDSDRVHYYYKAAIFETIGQLTTPTSAVIKLVDEYFEKDEWHRLILQTVYERHPVFIKHLSTLQGFDWLSEEGSYLLVSMRYYSSEFFISVLRKLMESKALTDQQALSFLRIEIDEETEELFDLRMEIYEKDITLLNNIHFINLENAQPEHIIKVLALVLSNIEAIGSQHVYIGDKERLRFCIENYNSIIHSLFDLLCDSAKNTPLSFHATILNYRERFWLPHEHEPSLAREIVDLVKGSLKTLSVNNPESALRYISKAGQYYNGISNELALSALLELPTTYSDSAIEWLLSDFDFHILDCISNEYDYLSTCKEVLKKHSATCSIELFVKLEDIICNWKGDREHFLDNYKYRVEINRSKELHPVFWPAWGHLQKALLPFLDSTRLKQRTKDLLAVLSRNDWVLSNSYHAGILSGPARTVVSTIHQNAALLSDKTWLKIVQANVDENHSGMREKDDGKYFYESSHWSFAQDLGACVKHDPTRYAKLVLKLPLGCFPGYFSSVLFSLSNPEAQDVDFDLLCDVIRYSKSIASDSIPVAITRIIREHLDEKWPKDIIAYLVQIATGNLKPIGNERIITSREEIPFPSPDDMEMEMLSCPRGAAVNTIGELLLNHDDYFELFAPVLETLALDDSDVIRYALVKCVAAFYNYDPAFSKYLFDTIIERDLLALYARLAFWLMRQDLAVLEKQYFKSLIKACESTNEKLVVRAGQMICTTAILTSNPHVIDFLYSHCWAKEALDKICLEATYAFEKEEYRAISQAILEHFLENNADGLHSINRLFNDNLLVLRRDEGFIIKILQKRKDIDTANAFIDYIKTQDADISAFAEIIKTAIESVDDKAGTWQKYRIEDGLIHAVIKLVDTARGDDTLSECCLDILDIIYRKRVLTDSAISKLLDGAK